ANSPAWQSEQKAEVGEACAIYPSHNLHMLLYAASMDGQGAIAMQAAKDFDKMEGDHVYPILTSIRFGRFDEVLEMTKRPEERNAAAVWDFGQGYARLRKGDKDAARTSLNRLLDAAAKASGTFRFNSARNVLGTLSGI